MNGLGGIGKTTLAYAYVNDDTYTKHYNHIAWVTVMDNIKDDLTNELSNDDTGFTYNPNEDIDANLKCLSDAMRHFDGDNLLVIDNANDSEDILNNKNSIETFGWKVLFTSRGKPAGTTIIPVEELKPEDAKELFCRFYKREIDDEVLAKLLAHIEYHTLLTELLAKAANKNKRLDIAALYDMVEREGIKAPRLGGKISIGKHADQRDIEKEHKLYNYILAIFDLSDLSEDEKEYLRYFSVLPSTTIEVKDLFDFFKIEEDNETTFYDILDELVKKGWLREIENSYKAHPLIQTVVREKLKPDAKNCSILIDAFIWKLNTGAVGNPLGKKIFIPYAESILSVIDEAEKGIATLTDKLSRIIEVFGNYGKALEYGLQALAIREKVLSKDDPDLSASYNNISLTYRNLGNFKKALEHGLKALEIGNKVLDKDHPNLATAYSNMSTIYQELGESKKALEYGLKDLGISEKGLNKDDPRLAAAYNNISITYRQLGDFEKALEYGLQALAIFAKGLLGEDHPDLAICFSNVSQTYHKLGDLNMCLEYELKALAIRQKVLDKDHPDLANSYGNISLTFQASSDFKNALEYGLKALAIREKVLDEDHPNLANSYFCIASTFHLLKDYSQAKGYIDKAVDIYQRVLPVEHPDLKNALVWQEAIHLELSEG